MTTLEIILGSITVICIILIIFEINFKLLLAKPICRILASKIFYYIVWLYWQKIRKNDDNFEKFKASRDNIKDILSKK